jgi:hypothetical protein
MTKNQMVTIAAAVREVAENLRGGARGEIMRERGDLEMAQWMRNQARVLDAAARDLEEGAK